MGPTRAWIGVEPGDLLVVELFGLALKHVVIALVLVRIIRWISCVSLLLHAVTNLIKLLLVSSNCHLFKIQ